MAGAYTLHKPLFHTLRFMAGPWFRKHYPVRLTNPEILKEMKPPYVLLPNHMMRWDMVLLGLIIRDPVHFMAADSHFRKNPARFFMKCLGAFPKAKAKNDTAAIRHMMSLREQSKAICIYPEGQMSWDGGSLPLYYSTAKLLKLLKMPVYVPAITGAYAFQPRWAKEKRNGPMEMTIRPLFKDPGELKNLSPDEIYKKMTALVHHTDEYDAIEERGWDYVSEAPAEYLENLLYLCPDCRRIAVLRSEGSRISCTACGFSLELNSRYRFSSPLEETLRFTTPREWNTWQRTALKGLLDEYSRGNEGKPFMIDRDLYIRTGERQSPLRVWTEKGELALLKDHLLLKSGEGEIRILPLEELSGIHVLTRHKLELYHNRTLYTFDFPDVRLSGYKWLCALRLMGLPSSYAWSDEEVEKI